MGVEQGLAGLTQDGCPLPGQLTQVKVLHVVAQASVDTGKSLTEQRNSFHSIVFIRLKIKIAMREQS